MRKKTNLFNKHSSNEQCTLVNSYLECITFFREEISKIKNRFDLKISKNENRFDLKIPKNENCLGLLRSLSTVCDFRNWMAMKTWTFIRKMEFINFGHFICLQLHGAFFFNCLEQNSQNSKWRCYHHYGINHQFLSNLVSLLMMMISYLRKNKTKKNEYHVSVQTNAPEK